MASDRRTEPPDSAEGRLLDLLEIWQDSRDSGRELTPEELCPDDPTLRDRLRECIAAARALDPDSELANTTVEDGHPTTTNQPPTISGYVVRGEIARGGMGVILAARDDALDRDVAIKVLVSSAKAAADRFVAEARITGRLQHPGVPPVHELGTTADGRPFLAMKLIEGRTLQELLDARPSPAADLPHLVQVFEQICQTVGYAHAQGVVHRDLKPLNVMVGAFGEVQVMDWGLAKLLGTPERERPETETHGQVATAHATRVGAILGTPAYMAPEQARGEPVDARADVFALGGILCTILTGAPPHSGRSAVDVVGRAAAGDLSHAMARLDGCGADAELVTLVRRCLDPRPDGRSPDAKSVAVAVTAYRAGVEERLRVADAERAAAQTRAAEQRRRTRVVAVSAAAVVLALTIGAALAMTFGLEARKQAKLAGEEANRANGEASRAEAKEADALREAARADREKNDAVAARNDLQIALVKVLLGPVGTSGRGALTPYESNTFWELAALRNGPSSYRFLEEATRTPLTSKQLESRAEFALHATIGLNPDLRDRLERLLLSRLTSPDTSAEQRQSLALVCARWDCVSPDTARQAATVLTHGVATTSNPDALSEMAEGLAALVGRVGPAEAASVCQPTANRLAELLAGATTTEAQYSLAVGLVAVVARTEPAAGAAILVDAIAKTTDSDALDELTECLGTLVARMEPAAANAVCDRAAAALADIVAKAADPVILGALAEVLATAAAKAEPAVAGRACSSATKLLVGTLRNAPPPILRTVLPSALAAVAPKADPATAAAAVEALIDETVRHPSAPMQRVLASSCADMAARLSPDTAAAMAKTLLDRMDRTTSLYTRSALASCLAGVTGQLEPAAAAGICESAARTILNAMAEPVDTPTLCALASALVALARRMEPVAASGVCELTARRITDTLGRTSSLHSARQLALELSPLVARMQPAAAAVVARTVTGAVVKPANLTAQSVWAVALHSVAARIEPGTAGAVAKTLAATAGRTDDPAVAGTIAGGLAAVARKLTPSDTAAVAKTLVAAMAKTPNPEVLAALVPGLSALAPGMDRKAAVRAATILIEAMPKTSDTDLESLAEGLAILAHRLEPKLADRAARTLKDLLSTALTEEAALAAALAEVAARLEPATAVRILLDTLPGVTDTDAHDSLRDGLRVVTLGVSAADLGLGSGAAILAGTSGAASGPLGSLPLLHSRFRPQARPLAPQVLVELLKHPLCVGDARRAALDALGFVYRRPFRDHWEFVRFVRDNNLPLDLDTPPRAPDPATPVRPAAERTDSAPITAPRARPVHLTLGVVPALGAVARERG
jgi:hypothetical protein